jgi:ATP-dependent DNA helicase UvrD/PcrA
MDNFQEHYKKLNDEQRQAVDLVEGSLLVLAGPGTGKTQLLSVRAANILKSKDVEPENILILTFTNAAARAMRDRLASMIGSKGYNIEVETFHSFANSIVLSSEGAINHIKERIDISEVEKIRMMGYILDNYKGAQGLRPFGAPYIHMREIEKRISELKNEDILPLDFKKQVKGLVPDGINLEEKNLSRLKALSVIYEQYERLKTEDPTVLFDARGRIDFDDMILIALKALREESELRDDFRERYKYVMVDEYQDTNRAQLELLFSVLDPDKGNVCCVGDDDQSIYRFQGAALSNFRVFREKFPELKEIALKKNYRSTAAIVKASSNIIMNLPKEERVAIKELESCKTYQHEGVRCVEFSTEEEEMLFLVREIECVADMIRDDSSLTEEERNNPYNNIAIILRRRSQIKKLIDVFLDKGVPYATDGKEDIRQEKRVRQMMDVLTLAGMGDDDNDEKSLILYRILTSDYSEVLLSDLMRFIGYVGECKARMRKKDDVERYSCCSFFSEFLRCFPCSGDVAPTKKDSGVLDIAMELGLQKPHALHKAAWAVSRMLCDAGSRPVHDILMRYIEDMAIYRFILDSYAENEVLKARDLRSLVSYISMVKQSDLSNPALNLHDFKDEMELREIHRMPVQGKMVTMSQNGVRLYTAHASKGLEFYAVFMPFCLDRKSWPFRGKSDVVPLPPDIYKSKEKVEEKSKIKELKLYDELRIFYVASTRAKASLTYTVTPAEKSISSPFLDYANVKKVSWTPDGENIFLGDFLSRSPENDTFDGSKDVLKDLVKNLTLTPTKLNTYISCPRKFLYNYVLGLPGKKTQHLVFGNCAHKGLEDVYEHFMKKKQFPDFEFFKNSFKRELEYQGVNDSIKNWCNDRLDTLELWYKRESKDPVMPDSLEEDLKVFFEEGLVFKGKFDKVEIDEDGAISVIDYKTGKPDKHIRAMSGCMDLSKHECDPYYRQLVAYKLIFDRAISKKGQGNIANGILKFLEPISKTVKKYDMTAGSFKDITVELTDAMVSELEKVIMDTWKGIQAVEFNKLPERDVKERCGRCEYDSMCWMG